MLSWVIYPVDFDPNKKYPTLLFCEGGPQSPVSQFWSYRWNFQIMAANDYIIIAPNRRGLPGFGMEWLEEISTNYGGHCMDDYLTAIDDIAKEPYVDKDRLGCVGASFGGYSVYWLAGHHNKRFKAFIAHDGFFNMEQQYLETEELWFTNWDLGGPYWDKNNPAVSVAMPTLLTCLSTMGYSYPLHPRRERLPHLGLTRYGRIQRCQTERHSCRTADFPGRKPLGIETSERYFVATHFFNWLDRWLKPQK